jgi:hypothetical protein
MSRGGTRIAETSAIWATLSRIAPEYIRSRLGAANPYRKAEDRERFSVFLRIAAGLEDPSAADALR